MEVAHKRKSITLRSFVPDFVFFGKAVEIVTF